MTEAQTVVMTGASRGIGRIAAQHLLADDERVHLVLLNRASSPGRRHELQGAGRPVSVIGCDLSSMQSVSEAAGAVMAQVDSGELPPIGALVGNAGVQHTNALTETVDGFESTFAVNVLANHLLVRRIHPHLPPQARIVVTVSDTHFGDLRHNLGMVPGPSWRPAEVLARVGAFANPASTTAGRTAYSTSKLAAIHLIHEYARRLPDGPDFAGYNPGFVPGTGLARDADAVSRFAMRTVMPLLALTPLATSPQRAGRLLADVIQGRIAAPSGAYVDRDRVARSAPESYDAERERALWDAVEALISPFLTDTDTTRIDQPETEK